MDNQKSISQAWLHTWFDIFNRTYFQGELPTPRLALSKARTRLGSMSCKRRFTSQGSKTFDYAIHISTYYQQTERQYQNVLLHEMIHYYISYKGIKDTAPHGQVFHSMMTTLNGKHGWEISVRSKMTETEYNAEYPNTKPYLVLVVETVEEQLFISVVNIKYTYDIQQQVNKFNEIKHHQWYISTNTYFHHFPAVRSLRGKKISAEELDSLLPMLKPFSPFG